MVLLLLGCGSSHVAVDKPPVSHALHCADKFDHGPPIALSVDQDGHRLPDGKRQIYTRCLSLGGGRPIATLEIPAGSAFLGDVFSGVRCAYCSALRELKEGRRREIPIAFDGRSLNFYEVRK